MSVPANVLFLSNVRISFPHLIEPQKTTNEVTGATRISYNAEFILPESHTGFAQFMSQYQAIMIDKFQENAPVVMGMILADRKLRCFGSGEEKINKKTFIPYDGYAGNKYITAGSDRQPQMIQDDGNPVDPVNTMAYQAIARKIYGGCRVNAAVKLWPQQNRHGNGIRCDLVAVQFAGDDKPFGEGGAPDVKGLFGAVAQVSAGAGMFSPAPAVLPSFFK